MKQSGLHPTNSTGVGNPGAFRMEIKIYSATGEERDITQLVDTFEVTESIFQQAMIGEFRIVDGVNLFEELNITGNEKLSVVLRKQLYGQGQAEEEEARRRARSEAHVRLPLPRAAAARAKFPSLTALPPILSEQRGHFLGALLQA